MAHISSNELYPIFLNYLLRYSEGNTPITEYCCRYERSIWECERGIVQKVESSYLCQSVGYFKNLDGRQSSEPTETFIRQTLNLSGLLGMRVILLLLVDDRHGVSQSTSSRLLVF